MLEFETRRRFDLLKPPRQVYASAWRQGFWVAVGACIVILLIVPDAFQNGWVSLFTPAVIGGLYALLQIHAAESVLSDAQRSRLKGQLVLVEQQEKLKAASTAAGGEIETGKAAMAKLAELSLRMQRLDDGTYGARIADLAHARAHWARRIKVNERLIAGYEHEWQMLAIEIDALDMPEIFPECGSAVMDAKVAELEALEESARERRRRRAAESEVSTICSTETL